MKYLSLQKICTILFEESSNYILKENNSAIKLFHNCQPSLICKVQGEGLVINSSLGFLMFLLWKYTWVSTASLNNFFGSK